MRVLGITETCDLGSLYMRLLAEGHDVKVTVSDALAQGTMAGLVPRAPNWREELDWIREDGGIIIFEAIGFGALQDDLRTQGFSVIGGSAFGDRLENDRSFALEMLGSRGLNIASTRQFDSGQAAIHDLRLRPRRCVYKRCDSAGDTFVGTFADGSDVAALLAVQSAQSGPGFILMDYIEGIETGVGAFFNGRQFLGPACLDWEHKRFFAGDMGELTGEMGTVATFTGSDRLFDLALAPLAPLLQEAGHVGWVNLNTIINEEGVWPLEFTCRFGYPGFAVLEPLQQISWGALLSEISTQCTVSFDALPGFSTGIVLTTPPMPLSRRQVDVPLGLPLFIGNVDPRHIHLGEVGSVNGTLITAGLYGWTLVVTGLGRTVLEAKDAAYANARNVHVPNMRYRLDIGDALIAGNLDRLVKWGWLE